VVVTDFQCPACKLFHERLELVFGERLGATDIRYAHLPLSYHAAALPAAKLFECAVRRGSVARRVATALFENQDSLALLSSADLLQRSGVTRVSEALDCIATADSTFFEAIWQSSSIARDVSVPGTPAVFLDGKLLALPPDETRLREIFSR
jgi:protein-disulfide isomerase